VRRPDMTLERLDPLSVAAARPVTIGIGVLAIAIAAIVSAISLHEVTRPLALAGALLATAGAATMLIVRAIGVRPPWSARAALSYQAILLTIPAVSATATFGSNDRLRDDWAPIVVGLFLLALAPYRPGAEIARWTALHVAIALVLGVMQGGWSIAGVPALVSGVVAAAPIAALGIASAAYAKSLTSAVASWQERAWMLAEGRAQVERGALALSVQQRRLAQLNREVIPLLDRVARSGEVDDLDARHAAALAGSVRTLLVAEADATWLDTMLQQVAERHSQRRVELLGSDDDNAAAQCSRLQRALLRAIVAESVESLGATRVRLNLDLLDGGRVRVRFDVASPLSASTARRRLAGVVELVRSIADRVAVREQQGTVALEFVYGY